MEGMGPMKSGNQYNYKVLNPTEIKFLEDEGKAKKCLTFSLKEVFFILKFRRKKNDKDFIYF